MKKGSALIVIDMISKIVHKDGKATSCAEMVEKKNVISNINKYTAEARKSGIPVIHVKVGFSENYAEQPKESPAFGKVDQFQALKLGEQNFIKMLMFNQLIQ